MDFKDILGEEIQQKKSQLEASKPAGPAKYLSRGEAERLENVQKQAGRNTAELEDEREQKRLKMEEIGGALQAPGESEDPHNGSPEDPHNGSSEDPHNGSSEDPHNGSSEDPHNGSPRDGAARNSALQSGPQSSLPPGAPQNRPFPDASQSGSLQNSSQMAPSGSTARKGPQASEKPGTDLSAMQIDQIDIHMIKKEPETVRSLIKLFLKRLMKEWEAHLEGQDNAEKTSSQGRMNRVLQKQSKENLQPFFKLLTKNALQPDVLENVTKICHFMQLRQYVSANDMYLRLAIGNAPWPIGVTAVGIHERSARERISSPQIAHALNDEISRKWLQAVKRLITFCQTMYPPTMRSQLMG